MTASIHPVAVPAQKPTRPEHQSARDNAGRPDRVELLIGDLHADLDYYQAVTDARAALTEFRPYDVAGSLADLHDALHPEEDR